MVEKNSGLLMSRRLLNDDDVDIHTSAREFIPIEKLDQVFTSEQGSVKVVRAFFTVGVVVEVFGPQTSKTGKQFSVFKLTDLVKYDLAKVIKELETKAQQNKQLFGGTNESVLEHVKQSMHSFNSNGYKTLKVLAFSEAAVPISKLGIGIVVGLLNPKLMRSF